MTRLSIEAVTSERRFAELEPAWNDLLARSAIAHPFVTHEWMWSWWNAFGGDASLRIVVVRDGARVVAIAPLMATNHRVLGRPLRYVEFMANDHTPRCDFLVAEGSDDAYSAVFDFVMGDAMRCDIVALREVPAGSRTNAALSSLRENADIVAGWRHSYDSPVLPLAHGWDDSLNPKRRWFLRNRLKKLSAHGAVELETIAAPARVADALEEGFALEAAAWKGEAGTAITSDANVRRFYTDLAMRAAARGWLRLQFLKSGETRVAFAYSLAYAGRMFLLKPGFDPRFAACSPGHLLTHLVLQDALASGFTLYEFLGRDDQWKRQWTNETVAHSWLFLYANRPWARAAHYTKFELLPALQRLPLYSRLRDSVLQFRSDS